MLKQILTSTVLLSLASGTVLADDQRNVPVKVHNVMGYTILVESLTSDTAASAKLASSWTTQSEPARAIPATRRGPCFDVVRESFERAGLITEPTATDLNVPAGPTASEYNALILDSFERAGVAPEGLPDACD
ncbi:MAG: hypothetical protein NXH97_13970 [Rhodobacteraceae bacterium]|nr:hypothetical protein [Paracoccaceae bacterium]